MLRWHNVGSISAFLMISDDRLERELPLSLGQSRL
jgi:hypothetical protein